MIDKICEFCGKEFASKLNRTKYCSKECYYESRKLNKNGINKTCPICGKEKYFPLSQSDRIFCSAECQHIWQSQTRTAENSPNWQGGAVELTCDNCGKVFLRERKGIKPNAEHIYCSKECTNEGRSKFSSIEKQCENCGKFFKVSNCRTDRKRFCSTECKDEYQYKTTHVDITCGICGNLFTVEKYRENKAQFCSVDCANIAHKDFMNTQEQIEKQSQKALEILSTYPRETSIEKAIREWLEDNNINHITQHIINDKFCVDFYLPDHNVIIEALGDYWHGNPKIYGVGEGLKPLNDTQNKCINRDKARFAYLRKCCFSIYGFWECDIKSNLDELMESIVELHYENKVI